MSPVRARTTRVIISGIDTPHLEIHCDYDVDQPVAVGSVTIPAPRPAHVQLGAFVDIHAGYDGNTSRIFYGRIPEDESAFTSAGSNVRVELESFGVYLDSYRSTDAVFDGNAALHDLFYAYCHEAGVPSYWSDLTYTVGGEVVRFGANMDIEAGQIIVDAATSFSQDLSRRAKLYGYRHYDVPTGTHRMSRVSGLPTSTPIRLFVEGQDFKSISHTRTIRGMANYIEVLGAQYTESATNEEKAIRSIPATVTPDPRYGRLGINKLTINDPDIVTQQRADDVRNVHEIDRSEEQVRWRWSVPGDPDLYPGAAASVLSPTVRGYDTDGVVGELIRNLPVAMWLMRVSHAITGQGWTTELEGWVGHGSPLPAGDDCVIYPLLGAEGRHLGTEYLSHYRRPNPDDVQVLIPFTVDADYSTLSIRGIAHGTNSFVANTESTASKFEIWQPHDTERAVASGEMPRQNENLEQRLPYGPDDTHWSRMSIPLTGSLKAGPATLKILSGYDSTVGDYDDFEVANLTLVTCGVGEPMVMG